jgi:hypothetical protein
MTERQLINVLESQVTESEASNYEVGEQRERNHRYYTLQPLGNEIDGRSQYISPDVLDSVEAKKAFFSETFFSGRKVVRFTPMGEGDNSEAQKRTAYVNMQLTRNDAFCMFRDGWHDAFVAKRMTVVAIWKDATETVTLQINGADQQQLQYIVQQQGDVVNADTSQLQPDPQQPQQPQQPGGQPQQPPAPTFSGPLVLEIDVGFVELKLIQPERVFRDPNATYVHDSQYFTFEEDLSRGELIRQGVNAEQAEKLTVDYRFRSEEEDNARKSHDRSWTRRQQHKRTDEQELITTYQTWTWLDMSEYDVMMGNGTDRSAKAHGGTGDGEIDPDQIGLYKIRWAHGEILMDQDGEMLVEKVTEIPAFEWTEFKISHAEHGLSDADVVAHSQRTLSTLKRLIIDNQQMRNTTRYEAVQGAIKNPRELIDNSIGGVIWSRAIGSVAALPTPELSPLAGQVIEMLDQDKEERSGVSRLSKGMNNDALRYQNAADMVERMTNASQMRVMRAARDFAESFLVPLSKYIYRVGVRNDKRAHTKEIAGRFQTITPSSWPDLDVTMEVSVALTPDAGQKHAQMLIQMHQMLSQDQTMMLGYGYAQKHAMIDDIFDYLGVADTSRYMLAPDSDEYRRKQEFQAKQAQAQQDEQKKRQQMMDAMQQKQMQMQMDDRKFDQWLKKSDDGRKWFDAETKKQNMASDNLLDDDKFQWDKVTDMMEYDLEKTQNRGVAL